MLTRSALLLLLLSVPAGAQPSEISVVRLKFTVQPAELFAVGRNMDHLLIETCNDGPAPAVIPWERISMSADHIRFIGTQDAAFLLAARQRRAPANVTARVVGLLAQGLAIGLAAANGRANAGWSTGLSIAGSVAPDVVRIARSQETAIAPALSTRQYPATLNRDQCFSDYQFAVHSRGMGVIQRSTIVFGDTAGKLTAELLELLSSHPVGTTQEINVR